MQTQQAVAYDVIFQLECSPELLLLALGTYLGEGCPTGVGNCSVNVGTTPTPNIRCPKIINGCTLLMNITMKVNELFAWIMRDNRDLTHTFFVFKEIPRSSTASFLCSGI